MINLRPELMLSQRRNSLSTYRRRNYGRRSPEASTSCSMLLWSLWEANPSRSQHVRHAQDVYVASRPIPLIF